MAKTAATFEMNFPRRLARRFYKRLLEKRLSSELSRQRAKLMFHAWGYLPLLVARGLSIAQRLTLIRRFLRIDWNIPHAHEPFEITNIVGELAARKARPGEVFLEAGCWKGGSTAKFSIICKMLGY